MDHELVRIKNQPIPSSLYDGLGGPELLAAMHKDGKSSLEQANKVQVRYARAVCRRAGVSFPEGFFDGDVNEIWQQRLQALGYS